MAFIQLFDRISSYCYPNKAGISEYEDFLKPRRGKFNTTEETVRDMSGQTKWKPTIFKDAPTSDITERGNESKGKQVASAKKNKNPLDAPTSAITVTGNESKFHRQKEIRSHWHL